MYQCHCYLTKIREYFIICHLLCVVFPSHWTIVASKFVNCTSFVVCCLHNYFMKRETGPNKVSWTEGCHFWIDPRGGEAKSVQSGLRFRFLESHLLNSGHCLTLVPNHLFELLLNDYYAYFLTWTALLCAWQSRWWTDSQVNSGCRCCCYFPEDGFFGFVDFVNELDPVSDVVDVVGAIEVRFSKWF